MVLESWRIIVYNTKVYVFIYKCSIARNRKMRGMYYMSASDKKKLRKEQAANALTERQRQEQAEAKKLKGYTIAFVSVMVAVILAAVIILGNTIVKQSGIIERNTVAAVVDGNKISVVEMSYYYSDAVNQFYSDAYNQYGDYLDYFLQMESLDPSTPVDQQTNPETGKPWSEYFLETALENAKRDYALVKAAAADNFTLPEEDRADIDAMFENIDAYVDAYGASTGFTSANKYLQAIYGSGANVKTYRAYAERAALANAYIVHHHDSLSYTTKDYDTYSADVVDNYNAYSYDTVYVSYTDFLADEAEDDTDEIKAQKEADAREAAKAAAEQLKTCTTVEELKEMVETIEVNEDSDLSVESCENNLHTSINKHLAAWLNDAARTEGELAVIENISTTTDKDGTESSVINGYYVTIFRSKRDNTQPMSNVRHLLVQFEESDEEVTEEQKKAAKEKADGYLKTWKEGAADEASFIELVEAHSDDSSAADGGLFEDINPDSQYVPNFLNWSIDPNRKVGDTDVIETEYGYHVMYFVGYSEMSYRNYMIDSEMRDADHDKWYEEVLQTVTAELKNTSRMKLGLTLSGY